MIIHSHKCPFCSTKYKDYIFCCEDIESNCPKCGNKTVAKTLINKKGINSKPNKKNQIKPQK